MHRAERTFPAALSFVPVETEHSNVVGGCVREELSEKAFLKETFDITSSLLGKGKK